MAEAQARGAAQSIPMTDKISRIFSNNPSMKPTTGWSAAL